MSGRCVVRGRGEVWSASCSQPPAMTRKLLLSTLVVAWIPLGVGCVSDETNEDSSPIVSSGDKGPVAFLADDIQLRDPHVYVASGGKCSDITDSVNQQIDHALSHDRGDGFLTVSPTLVFRPLQPDRSSGPVELQFAKCAADDVRCWPGYATPDASTASNLQSGTCLSPVSNTTNSKYNPPIKSPKAQCFSNREATVTVRIGGVDVTLTHARIGARYQGGNTKKLKDGLVRGFLTEASANATILPASLPVVGGQPVSKLLAGGTGSCAKFSDKDTVEGASGWWIYLQFGAQQVRWSDR
jgi:hypothetical protein